MNPITAPRACRGCDQVCGVGDASDPTSLLDHHDALLEHPLTAPGADDGSRPTGFIEDARGFIPKLHCVWT